MSNLGRIEDLFRQLHLEVELLAAENAELRHSLAQYERSGDTTPEQVPLDDTEPPLSPEKDTPAPAVVDAPSEAPKQGGKLKAVKALLKAGASIHQGKDGYTALHGAAAEGHEKIVKRLLEAGLETTM